ncbi:MAG: hypothetical protein GY792_35505, partial [Gammaproteobacteria bacterium]|nr:hypothetical protein [Gammaproteobacteria bacterium]
MHGLAYYACGCIESSSSLLHTVTFLYCTLSGYRPSPGRSCDQGLSGRHIKKYCKADEKTTRYLGLAAEKLRLSARGGSSILKVARTIADLVGASEINTAHISEAIQSAILNVSQKSGKRRALTRV